MSFLSRSRGNGGSGNGIIQSREELLANAISYNADQAEQAFPKNAATRFWVGDHKLSRFVNTTKAILATFGNRAFDFSPAR